MTARWPGRISVVALALLVLVGLGIGAVMLLSSGSGKSQTASEAGDLWTCSMHPQVRLPNPGKCPICSMPLVPAGRISSPRAAGETGPTLSLSEHARGMASVETQAVERRKLTREVRAVGKVQYNESALATVTARVDGYIEKLFVDYTGVEVKAGEHLVEIYSPELLVAQKEMLMNPADASIVDLVRMKLRRWEVPEEQIEETLRTRQARDRITLSSPIEGTVTEKMVVAKSAVKAGDVLYKLANLDSVWVYLDIYEYELASVRYGQTVEIKTEAYPGEVFTGRIWFINPVLSDESRTVKVLVNIANKDKRLKPGMFVSATIRAGLLVNGQLAPTGVEGKWTCRMHPQVLESEGGPCPVCKMPLTQIPPASHPDTPGADLVLAVPITAVLDSGTRKIAYVERGPGEYAAVALELGPRAGDYYPVTAGLKEGDRVATRGNFLLDSQSQISGMPSLFYEHGQAGSMGHQHGDTGPAHAPGALPPRGNPSPLKPPEHKH